MAHAGPICNKQCMSEVLFRNDVIEKKLHLFKQT